MKWNEIVNESDSMTLDARSVVMDFLAPLKAQGMNGIAVQQVIDQLKVDPKFQGLEIDSGFIMNVLNGVPRIKIEKDVDNGEMMISLQDVKKTRQVDDEQAEKEKQDINKAALRTIANKRKD